MVSEQLIEQFVHITDASPYLAEQYLRRNNGDLVKSVEEYYAAGEPARKPAKKAQGGKKGLRTLRDLNDSDSESDKTNTNFFTGGEKSALQVEDPNKNRDSEQSIIDKIFERARQQMSEPDDRPSASQPEPPQRKFKGTGFKLGDGEEPSEVIRDPNAFEDELPSKVTREITFWKQGFTVGDGPLNRYDDPANATVLDELNKGRVPVSILGVSHGQDVDVSVFRKTEEDYVPPKRKLGGYVGTGHRLGSPVPGEIPKEPSPVPEASDKPTEPSGQGDAVVQIRFATGKRVVQKFNSSDPVSEVYAFVASHEYNSTPGRKFILSMAFPVKEIENSDDLTVADAKLNNAVVVQRWA